MWLLWAEGPTRLPMPLHQHTQRAMRAELLLVQSGVPWLCDTWRRCCGLRSVACVCHVPWHVGGPFQLGKVPALWASSSHDK